MSDVRSAVAASCSGEEVTRRTVRALAVVLSRWKAVTPDDKHFPALENALLEAVAALTVASQLSPQELDLALAPFGLSAAGLSAAGEATPSAVCAPDAQARMVEASEPNFPPAAKRQRLGAVIQVAVVLDDEGLVESARVFKVIPDVGAVGSAAAAATWALENSAVVASAATTYRSAIENCKAIGGQYLFSVTFTGGA